MTLTAVLTATVAKTLRRRAKICARPRWRRRRSRLCEREAPTPMAMATAIAPMGRLGRGMAALWAAAAGTAGLLTKAPPAPALARAIETCPPAAAYELLGAATPLRRRFSSNHIAMTRSHRSSHHHATTNLRSRMGAARRMTTRCEAAAPTLGPEEGHRRAVPMAALRLSTLASGVRGGGSGGRRRQAAAPSCNALCVNKCKCRRPPDSVQGSGCA